MKFVHCMTIALILCVAMGCKPRAQASSNASDKLSSESFVGSWGTQSVVIVLRNKDGKGQNEVPLFPVEGTTKGVQPVTHIQGDGIYREEVLDEKGELSVSRKGTWHYYQDSLFVRMETPKNSGMNFGVRQKGKKLTLTNLVDWNADGKKEEEMRIVLERR